MRSSMEGLFVDGGRLKAPSNYIFPVNTFSIGGEGALQLHFPVNTFAIGGRLPKAPKEGPMAQCPPPPACAPVCEV